MANGTYGDTAFNPLVGKADGLRKNYDNKNWVFYDPRRFRSYLVGAAASDSVDDYTFNIINFSNTAIPIAVSPPTYPIGPDEVSTTVIRAADPGGTPSTFSGSRVQSILEAKTVTVDSHGVLQRFVLPIKGEDFIYCQWYLRQEFRTTFVERNAGISYYIVKYPVSTVLYGQYTDVTLESVIPATLEIAESLASTQKDAKCVLVTPNGAREVPFPAELDLRLSGLADYEPTPYTIGQDTQNVDRGYTIDSVNPIIWKGVEVITIPVAVPPVFIDPPGVIESNPLSKFGLTNYSYDEPSGTPGIYSILDNLALLTDQDVLNADQNTPEGWNLLLSKISGPAPESALGLCALDGSCNETRVAFDLLNQPTIIPRVYTRNTAADIQTGPGKFGNSSPDNINLYPEIFSWDWGKPDYCRTKLAELGFQPEDLVLELPPSP
jgi:hypothetical protein